MAFAAMKTVRRLGLVTRSLPQTTLLVRGALFRGDIPPVHRSRAIGALDASAILPGSGPVNFVCGEDFAEPRPACSRHRNVTYTPAGHAWVNRSLDISLSAREPSSLAEVLTGPLHRPRTEIASATIVQSQHPNTYGDWTSEHMKSIALCPDFPRPLVLPREFAGRSYVRGELDQLGIDHIIIDRPVLIRDATVLHKARPITLWTRDDVDAYRRLFAITPPVPRAGSILYLSRSGVRSEQAKTRRQFPSETIARIVERLGGRVILTEGMTREDFSRLAGEAETVIADHGAALFNILQWNTRSLVEIVTDNWWSRCFVFLGTSCGVGHHAVVRCDGRSEADLGSILQGHLAAFQA